MKDALIYGTIAILLVICWIYIVNHWFLPKIEIVDESNYYPVEMKDMPYPSTIVDTIVFPPQYANGYWDTKEPRLKVVSYKTEIGEFDVFIYNRHVDQMIEDIFEGKRHLITEVDKNGNHWGIHIIKPE